MSTPYIGKCMKPGPFPQDTIGQTQPVQVLVHDGLGMRRISITPLDTQLDVLEKTASAMKRPNHAIEIGYEAPWSSKIGTKKSLAYLSTQEELIDFWIAYKRYIKGQLSKKKKGQEINCEIVFRNMMDNLAAVSVSFLLIYSTSKTNTEPNEDCIPCKGWEQGI